MVAACSCALVLLGDGGATRYAVTVADSGQLVKGDEVRVGGRPVGAVEAVELSGDGRARVTFSVREPVAPLRSGTRVTVRAASLTGVANRYLALAPGPATGSELPEGATLASSDVTPLVELDELLAAFDPQTRDGLRSAIRGLDRQLDGRGREAGVAAENLDPALQAVRGLAQDVTADGADLQRFVRSSATLVRAVAERRDELSGSVQGAADALGAVAGEDRALGRALAAAPGALRSTTTGLAGLRRALPDLERLVTESDRAATDLTPFLADLRPTVTASRPVLASLRGAIAGPGSADDLTDLLRRAPRLAATARPALRATSAALADGLDLVTFARPYAPDLTGVLRDLGQSTAAYDANGHYARVQPVFNAFEPSGAGQVPRADRLRLEGFETLQLRRCPGGAGAPRADGSAPWRDVDGTLDCDPATSPGAP